MAKTEKQFRAGEQLNLSSADHDLEAWFDDSSNWQGGFKIWFNGTLVHSSKTFKSFEKKLNALTVKYELTEAN